MTVEEQVRHEHPDWTDEQVAAEVTRREAQPPAPVPTPPAPPAPENAAFAEMRRQLRAAEDRAKALEDAAAEQQRLAAEQQGEYKRLYEETKAELDKLKADVASVQAKGVEEKLVTSIATGLKFKHADEALALLPADVDRSDDGAVRAALEKLATERPHLVNGKPAPPSGLPPGPNGDPDPSAEITAEKLRAMTPDQVAKLMKSNPDAVNKALAAT